MRVDENKISRSSDARMSEVIESAEKQPQPAKVLQRDHEVCDSPVLPELHMAANSAAAVQIDAGGMDGHQSTLYKAVCRSFAGKSPVVNTVYILTTNSLHILRNSAN